MPARYRLRIGVGIGLLSGALIQTELLLTRLLSVVVWYHFAFVAISVALFGFGVAAVVVHLAGARARGSWIGYGAAAAALAIVAVDLALLHVTPDWASAGLTRPSGRLALLFVLAALPFCCGGLSVALALARWSSSVHRIYFWDLVGAGLGGASVVPLLDLVGAPVALLTPALVCGVAALALASGTRRERFAAASALVVPFALLLWAPVSRMFEIRNAKGVPLASLAPEFNRWNSFSMVTVLPGAGFRGWAPSTRYTGAIPEQKSLVIDMNAMTPLTRLSGPPSQLTHLAYDLSAFVYRVRPNTGSACVLGAGGGRDVLSALASGSRHVTGVEINSLIVNDVVKGQYRDFTGDLYRRPDVTVAVEDGRSYVARSERRFDVVHLSMVDTSAATAAGAYALTENSLYTRESFVELARHLAPGGVLSVGSVSLPGLAVGARLASVARAALEELGRDPASGIAVVAAPWPGMAGAVMYDVLIAPDGFTEADRARIATDARALAFAPIYVPGAPPHAIAGEPGQIINIIRATNPAELASAQLGPLDVSATTDDRPFFFYQNRIRDFGRALSPSSATHLIGNGMPILAKLLVVSLVLAVVLVLLPLLAGGARVRAGSGSALFDGAYAAALGAGFMFIEIGLLQRSSLQVAHPAATLTVVLLVLLVTGGIGSALFAGQHTVRRATRVLAAVVVLALLFAAFGDALATATHRLSGTGRAISLGVAIVPLALMMGAPLPLGLGAVGRRAPGRVPWLWAVTGATSVVASVLATMTGLHFGIRAVLMTGAAIYAITLVLARRVATEPA